MSKLKKKDLLVRIEQLERAVQSLELRLKSLENTSGSLVVPADQNSFYVPLKGTLQALQRCQGMCDYPNPWGATIPPTCRKCGCQAPWNLMVTGGDGSSSNIAGIGLIHTINTTNTKNTKN